MLTVSVSRTDGFSFYAIANRMCVLLNSICLAGHWRFSCLTLRWYSFSLCLGEKFEVGFSELSYSKRALQIFLVEEKERNYFG